MPNDDLWTALADVGYELREVGSGNDKYAIVLPAEIEEEDDAEEIDLEEMTNDELYKLAQE